MSAKSAKQKPKPSQPPRELEAIKQEYAQVCAQAGQLQYTVAVNTAELKNLNDKLLKINQEANSRNELDKLTTVTQKPAEQSQAV